MASSSRIRSGATSAANRTIWRASIPPSDAISISRSLRAFDERILGRTFAESDSFGNFFNLHEGLLVYSLTFATLLVLYGTVRHLPALLRGRRLVNEDAPFHLAFVAFCVFVVLSKLGFTIMYVLMDRIDFIHARILVAGMLPLATLASAYLYHLGGGSQHERPILPRWPQLVAAALAAGLLVAGSEHVADATAGRPIPLGISEGFTANLTLSAGSVLRVGFSLFLFAAVLAASLGLARRSPWRGPLMAFLAFLMIFQAAAFGAFQLRGDQLRSDWRPLREPAGETKKPEGEPMPFEQAGRLLARADEFKGPTQASLSAIDRRLERDDYRTAIVCDPSRIKIFCSPHIANFWRLRLIEGYISSIPERLEILPWPADSLSQRSISFPSFASLPWPLLSLLNVKYAIAVQPALFTNAVRLLDGTTRELRPEDLEIRQSPLPVTPRVFFASTVQSLAGPEAVLEALFPKGQLRPEGYDAKRLSYVEDAVGGSYGTAGQEELKASFRDQYATIEFPPAATPRFLVVNERFDPYWRAYIGGKAARIYPTNVVMRGVVVPPGAREVTMIYRPYDTSGRAWAFYLAGLALFGLGCWGVGRIDRQFPTLSAAEMARPMRRAASWLRTRSSAWIAGDEAALFRSLAAISMVWAMVVVLRYLHEPKLLLIAVACPLAGLLLVRLDLRFGWRAAASADRLGTHRRLCLHAGDLVGQHRPVEADRRLLRHSRHRRIRGDFPLESPRQGHRVILPPGSRRKLRSRGAGLFLYSSPEFHLAALCHDRHRVGHDARDASSSPASCCRRSRFCWAFSRCRRLVRADRRARDGRILCDLLRRLFRPSRRPAARAACRHAVASYLPDGARMGRAAGAPARPQYRAGRTVRIHRVVGLGVLCLLPRFLFNVERLRAPQGRRAAPPRLGHRALGADVPRLSLHYRRAHWLQVLRDRSARHVFRTDGQRVVGSDFGGDPGPSEVPRAVPGQPHRHVGRDPDAVRLRDVVTAYWQVMLAGSSWVARLLFATFIACWARRCCASRSSARRDRRAGYDGGARAWLRDCQRWSRS